ncbi:class I SAM-dependent methyltransferase [Microbacterium thalassium]|uniref:SAM-dependent methyltransferase n=1 Tax=Microbacterium thalassium TaxID=362649 RepID=A0A7X0KTW6_9MICO|nr:class I SAM-dependent methyltransferase [Microbacterium thalassium]MBB6390555.1 SAM-dependent methyltransferase [Microbacterium thalassium]GLK25666.1 hypothetical protein GCM10017607_29850 [Microbacterium thalassium]
MSRRHRYLEPEQAARVYDRIGRWQDLGGFYEREAMGVMLDAAELGSARGVVEIGCGTGSLAASLLGDRLPAAATYLGLDVSPAMVERTRRAVEPFADRAEVRLVDGRSPWPIADHSVDRVLAVYVLDLYSPEATDAFFAEADRVLRPGRLIAVASLTHGARGVSRAVSAMWNGAWRIDPHVTGGCRPVDLEPHLPSTYRRRLDTVITTWGVSSRALVLQAPA